MDKLLTIAIPTYLCSQELKRALEAIEKQYDERIEVLVSNDNSPDDTDDIVAEIQKRMPIHYIKNKTNLGYDRNFLQCYKEASGKYVMLMGNDDYLLDGSISHMLNYLEQNPSVDWVFVNFKTFTKNGDQLFFNSPKCEEIGDKEHVSKDDFIKYASVWISTLSSIVNREKVLRIKNYDEYIGTVFMAICIPLEITGVEPYNLGIIGKALIAYNQPFNEYINNTFFVRNGTGIKFALCEVGPKFGYNKKLMRKAFYDGVRTWRIPIITLKAEKDKSRRKLFWKDGFESIKDFPAAWVNIIPYALIPHWFAKFLINYIKPIYRKYIRFNIERSE